MSSPLVAGSALGLQLRSQNSFALDSATSQASTVVTNAGKFGTILSAATTTGTKTGTTGQAGAGGGTASTSNSGTGFTTVGVKRTPQFATRPDENILPRQGLAQVPLQMQADVRSALTETTVFPAGRNVSVAVNDQQQVVLTGTVASERDRMMAEGLVRLTPGVQFVRNEIVVLPPEAK